MRSFITALTASALSAQVLAAGPKEPFSNQFSVGFGEGAPYIREATSTLILPPINPTQKGLLRLYPEVYSSGTASLTGTAINLLDEMNPCPDNLADWCVGTRLVVVNGTFNLQNSGTYVPARAGSRLTIKVTYDDATQKHDHTLAIDGVIVSTLPVNSPLNLNVGRGIGWRTMVECQNELCGAVASHTYVNTKIVLDQKDLTFPSTLYTQGASGSSLKTADGGLTWTIDEIVVKSFTYDE